MEKFSVKYKDQTISSDRNIDNSCKNLRIELVVIAKVQGPKGSVDFPALQAHIFAVGYLHQERFREHCKKIYLPSSSSESCCLDLWKFDRFIFEENPEET